MSEEVWAPFGDDEFQAKLFDMLNSLGLKRANEFTQRDSSLVLLLSTYGDKKALDMSADMRTCYAKTVKAGRKALPSESDAVRLHQDVARRPCNIQVRALRRIREGIRERSTNADAAHQNNIR